MPITKREEAKESGFQQVREALQRFKGLCTGASFDMWGGETPKEYLELTFTNVEVLESTEELAMDITEEWSVRINCSNFKGSFWVEMFLASVEKLNVEIPEGLEGQVLTMEKQTLENKNPQFNATGWVLIAIEAPAKGTVKKEAPKAPPSTASVDPSATILELAVGKNDEQLTAAIKEALKGHPMLPLAEAGMLTQALVSANKLVLVDGIYQLPS